MGRSASRVSSDAAAGAAYLSTGRKIGPAFGPSSQSAARAAPSYHPAPPGTRQGGPSAPCRDCDRSNVTAAQWSSNGSTAPGDLTAPGAVDLRSQRVRPRRAAHTPAQARPSASSRHTIDRGEPLDPDLADAVAAAMKDWALEKGATHFTHWFQPLTGSTAEKHDSLLRAGRRRHGHRRVLGQGADPGRARRLELPHGRHPRHLRGPRLHRLGPHQPGLHPREPQRRGPLHPDRLRVVDRRGPRHQDPAAALDGGADKSALRALRLFGDTTPSASSPRSGRSRSTS